MPTATTHNPGPVGARVTPLGARGEPMVWLTGAALVVCMLMISALLAIVVYSGSRAFWPRPIDRVTLRSGEVFLGVPTSEEAFTPTEEQAAGIRALQAAGALPIGAVDAHGRPIRRLYRVGNREFRGQPFVWTPLFEVASIDRPADAVMLERQAWGVWLGVPEAIVSQEETVVAGPPESIAGRRTVPAPGGAREAQRTVLGPAEGGGTRVLERVALARGPGATMDVYRRLHPEAVARRERLESLRQDAIGDVNAALERERLRLREAALDMGRAGAERPPALTAPLFAVLLLGAAGALVWAVRLTRRALREGVRTRGSAWSTAGLAALWISAGVAGLGLWLENPWSRDAITPAEFAAAQERHDAAVARLGAQYDALRATTRAIERDDARMRLIVVDPSTGRFAPRRQTEPDEPMLLSQVVRSVQPNKLTFWGKLAVYADRWREFLLDQPRESNTEGGVFPVIFGTVLLTLLLSVAVAPLGVVAALYLREYARQGALTSLVRIAVNNLAGVPSIVYGVFGLGFFCYTVGQYIDAGPKTAWPRGVWWGMLAVLALAALLAVTLGRLARARHGAHQTWAQRRAMTLAVAFWLGCTALAAALVITTPYFHGFFEARLPNPTFGTKGLLWSALTLALLTLPVVIVATEEAIAAVPRSMREGSYGCGASKWQTIRRIVLPRAMPGIMTGMILAMARGAGEVAPLMLVGAVKSAPELPVSSTFPFLHLERSFMHLGFHIYDVGFQSPDSEAARPLVWCTTLLLIVIVLLLLTTAIRIRSGLRRRYLGEAF